MIIEELESEIAVPGSKYHFKEVLTMNNNVAIFCAGAVTATLCLYLIDEYRARLRFRRGFGKAIRHAGKIWAEYEKEERRKNGRNN